MSVNAKICHTCHTCHTSKAPFLGTIFYENQYEINAKSTSKYMFFTKKPIDICENFHKLWV